MNVASFIALRWLKTKPNHHTQKNIQTRGMIRLGMAGIALSIALMIIAVCVLIGFKNQVSSKAYYFSGHLQIRSYINSGEEAASSNTGGENLFSDVLPSFKVDPKIERRILDLPEVVSLEKTCSKGGLLKQNEIISGVMFNGTDRIQGESLSVSETLAKQTGWKKGDKARAYFMGGQKTAEGFSVAQRAFKIDTIYETGLEKLDETMVFCSLEQIQRLNGWDRNRIEAYKIILKNPQERDDVAKKINAFLPYHMICLTCDEIYPEIFRWLALMDMNVIVLFFIMAIVASISLISVLYILIIEHAHGIAVLKTLGAQEKLLRAVFIRQTSVLLFQGLLWGNGLAFLLCLSQDQWHWLKLDRATYYLDYAPVEFQWTAILLMNLACIFVSISTVLLTCRNISQKLPSRSLLLNR